MMRFIPNFVSTKLYQVKQYFSGAESAELEGAGVVSKNSRANVKIFENERIVPIQNLPSVPKRDNGPGNPRELLKGYKCKCYNKCTCTIMTYMENNKANTNFNIDPFLGAVLKAYDQHEDLILSPDDIWLMISFAFSKYVNDNSEKMRHLFVDHEGKKTLTVVTENESSEEQWNEFFDLMIAAIGQSVKGDTVQILANNFSTTTNIEKIMSTAVIMDSFKNYFTYGRCIPCCGISNVVFMGTIDDWTKIVDKITMLKKFDIDGKWNSYVANLLPVLQQFINTFNGEVDIDFWNKIIQLNYASIGSGSTSTITGWVLNFYGLTGTVDTGSINGNMFTVPVIIDNRLTGEMKTVHIVGGFTGITKIKSGYRPQMSLIVRHNPNYVEEDTGPRKTIYHMH